MHHESSRGESIAPDFAENGERHGCPRCATWHGLGPGGGRAAAAVIAEPGWRVQSEGLAVSAVAASRMTARQARTASVEVLQADDIADLDLGFDGTDVSPGISSS